MLKRTGRGILALFTCTALFAGLVVTASLGPAAAATIEADVDVEYVSSGIPIQASYRAPAPGSNGVLAAVIVGGTGAVDRNGNAEGLPMDQYEWLADLLSAQGVASIRYDKVGTGGTGLGPYTSDPSVMLPLGYDELRVQPARDAMSFLASQPGIDPDRIMLIGHSEGGAVALTVVNDPGDAPAPAALALVEPAYTHILDILDQQFSVQMDAAVGGSAMTEEDADTLKAWMRAGMEEIRTGTPPYPAPGPVPLPGATDYTALMQSTIGSNIYGSDPAQMVLTHSFRTRYGKDYDAIDPATLAADVRIPTFITCGTKDFNTPCGDGTPGSGVIAVANSFQPGVARFVVLPDTVHILRDVGDANPTALADQITYPLSALLAAEFSAFVADFAAPVPTIPTTIPPAVTPTFTG